MGHYYSDREDYLKRKRASSKYRYHNDPEYREQLLAAQRRRRQEKKLLREWGIE